MNTHALHVLEFEVALEHVACFAASESGRRAVRGLAPLVEVSTIRAELNLVREGIALLGRDEGWVMPDFPDLTEPLQRLRIPGYDWEPDTLRSGHDLLTASRNTRRATTADAADLPGIAGLGKGLADLPAVIAELDRTIDEDGTVRDKASPELARLRREIAGARSRIVQRLSE
jgi:DNA mismatch repair protein MutS2